MKKRGLVRLQLFALFAVVLLLGYRMLAGDDTPSGALVLEDLNDQPFQQSAFIAEEPMAVVINAVGSFERKDAPRLAAYGWILRSSTRDVVWDMNDANVSEGRGLSAVAHDTLRLEPGRYEVYFTSGGNEIRFDDNDGIISGLFNTEQPWRSDASKWQMQLSPVDPAAAFSIDYGFDRYSAEGSVRLPGTIWSSAPAGDSEEKQLLFEVKAPTMVGLRAIGEISQTPDDYSWIRNELTGEKVWSLTEANTKPAGGVPENRMADTKLRLEPGVYTAGTDTDRGHDYYEWYGNPPLDPLFYGLTLRAIPARDSVNAMPFDAWASRSPLAEIMRVTNNQQLSTQIRVKTPLKGIITAMGEISSSVYDYGWIVDDRTGNTIWELSDDNSKWAGGNENNRSGTAFLDLQPGTYTLHYRTDGSHAYNDFDDGEPENSDRWGIALFALDRNVSDENYEVTQEAQRGASAMVDTEAMETMLPRFDIPEDQILVEHTQVGDNANIESTFSIDEDSELYIYALGELSFSVQYDYGWIERADTRETVWEMTWDNTETAGADGRSRYFSGIITLPAGEYIVYFKTDFSHAYGSFGRDEPPNADAWGITIARGEP
ncbi:MAG: hypothetical protein RhofKO_03140 [Rhodothermales bacterium]